jgi:hypothetical protein
MPSSKKCKTDQSKTWKSKQRRKPTLGVTDALSTLGAARNQTAGKIPWRYSKPDQARETANAVDALSMKRKSETETGFNRRQRNLARKMVRTSEIRKTKITGAR